MTVAEMIEKLQALPQDPEVWSYGMDVHGYAENVLAVPPVIDESLAKLLGERRVVIDGGLV